MPLYETQCQECKVTASRKMSFDIYESVMAGRVRVSCMKCGGALALVFAPGSVNFVLKDGESGGWISKAMKENKYRANRQQVMERRQRDHAPNPKLVPNFAGETLGSWAEAKQAAYDKALSETKDVSAAREASSTYDGLVKQEKTP